MIHTRTVTTNGETFHFASLDGDHWLPFTRPAQDGDEEAVRAGFEGDGNFKPMTFGTGFLDHLAEGGWASRLVPSSGSPNPHGSSSS